MNLRIRVNWSVAKTNILVFSKDFYSLVAVKFCVADGLDFIDDFNAAFFAYADARAG